MLADMSFGTRLRYHRERAGKTRAVLGGLVGRSEEWVKAVETGRLLTPRLPMLLRLADVLGITDLAQLTGDQSIPVASVSKAAHDATGDVATLATRGFSRFQLCSGGKIMRKLVDRVVGRRSDNDGVCSRQ